MDLVADDRLYADPDLQLQDNPGAITPAALTRLEAMLRAPLMRQDLLGRWFGSHVTKLPVAMGQEANQAKKRRRVPSAERVLTGLAADRVIWRSDGSRFAYFAPDNSTFYFYVDGDEQQFSKEIKPLVEALCLRRRHHGRDLAALLPRGKQRIVAVAMLRQLLAHGALYLE
jgi:50S ribosomal protein L16 3-hydroxylase